MKIQKPIAILLTFVFLCSLLSACESSDYKDADMLFADSKYEEAITAFKALGNYKDAEHRADEAAYFLAKQLLDDGNWSEAANTAKSIVTDDSELVNLIDPLLSRCDLRQAEELLLAGKSKQAIEICQTVKKKTTNSSIVVAADALQKKCQDALSLGDVNKLLETARAEYQNGNWQIAISVCQEIFEIAPNTEFATEAESLKKQSKSEIENELSKLMTNLETAYDNGEWDAVLEITATILDGYSEYVSDRENIEQQRGDASKKLQEEVNEKLGPALEKLKEEYDEVEDTTWYMPNSTPQYINDYCVSYLYIGNRESRSPWLRWRTIYVDDEWLYFDELIINVDGTVYSINCKYDDTVRDSNRKNHWEYVDFQPKPSQLDIVRAIINSENTVIRFSNDDDDKIYDYTVTQKEKDGFKDILEAFELMQHKQ